MAILYTDAFTVGADTNLPSYGAPDYEYITSGAAAGDLVVNNANDRVQNTLAATVRSARCIRPNVPQYDQECTVTVLFDQANTITGGPFVRATSNTNGYVARINVSTLDLEIARYDDGSFTSLITAARGIGAASASHTIRLRALGIGATVYLWAQVDSTRPLTFADSNAARKLTGFPGFFMTNATANTGWIDNFQYDDLGSTGVMAHAGTLLLNTGAAATQYSYVGCPFQPKAALFFAGGRTTATVSVQGEGDCWKLFGAAVSASDRRCIGVVHDHGNTAIANDRAHRNEAIAVLQAVSTGTVDSLADFVSFDAYGFTVVIDDQFPTARELSFLLLGGDDFTNFATGQFQEPGATGEWDAITGLSFTPDGVVFFSSGDNTAPNSTVTEGQCMIGAAGRFGTPAVYCSGSDDAPASSTSDTARYVKTGECLALMTNGGTPVTTDFRASFVQFNSDGVRLNAIERAQTRYIHYLAWKGGRFRVDNFLSQTSLTTTTEASYEDRPRGLLILSGCAAEQTADTPAAHDELSIGAWGDVPGQVSNQVCHGIGDKDASATQDSWSALRFGSCYVNGSQATKMALEGEARITQIDAAGFVQTMIDADPAQAMEVALVWMDSVPATPLAPEMPPMRAA